MSVKIVVTGSAGQGVLWLGKKIAEEVLAKNPKKFVSVLDEYEAGVRTGRSGCQIVISDKEITCPFVDKADIFIELEKKRVACGNEVLELNGEKRVNEEALEKVRKCLKIK